MATSKTKRGERITDIAQKKAAERVPMSVAQLAEYTGWAKCTIYSKVNRRELPYYKVAGSTRVIFDKTEIDNILFAHRVASNEEVRMQAEANIAKGGLEVCGSKKSL